MSDKLFFLIGFLGVIFFVIPSVLGGYLINGYDPISQLISESMAIDTPYSKELRYFGYIPSGILLTLFGIIGSKKFQHYNLAKIGFWGIAIFYGMATIVVGIFPCDSGCNKEFIDPSVSQFIHNLTGMLTYLLVPISILVIGLGLRKSKKFKHLSIIGIVCGLICMVLVGLLSDPLSIYAGLFQRLIEGIFIIWILICAIYVNKVSNLRNEN